MTLKPSLFLFIPDCLENNFVFFVSMHLDQVWISDQCKHLHACRTWRPQVGGKGSKIWRNFAEENWLTPQVKVHRCHHDLTWNNHICRSTFKHHGTDVKNWSENRTWFGWALPVCVCLYRPVHIGLSAPDIITNKIPFGYSCTAVELVFSFFHLAAGNKV